MDNQLCDISEILQEGAELQDTLSSIKSPFEKENCILKYIQKRDNLNVPKCPNFASDLEWFNVSTPLHLQKHLRGKIVVLDFFTYCCINCMHILPDLHELEGKFTVEDGVAVLGVHSAKFENEKVSSNILNAVLRYDITHPVVNDYEAYLWFKLQITVWPTLLILGPDQTVLFALMGEGHRELLLNFVNAAHKHYLGKGRLSSHQLPLQLRKQSLQPSPLLFPGKVAYDSTGEFLAISDTGHHRLLIVNGKGVVQFTAGDGTSGFVDGGFSEARFHAPQGICWEGSDFLYIADTENHAIRKVDVVNGVVSTLSGTGKQGNDNIGGAVNTDQPLSSPWDVSLAKSPDCASEQSDLLLIAMAGSHQVWVYFLQSATILKKKYYDAGTCVCFAGSGKEENRNSGYPHTAAFAQPSGIALAQKSEDGHQKFLYVADSESSTVREVSLVNGAVKNVVGGEINPQNLFAFGDTDGVKVNVKLQHPLGITAKHGQPEVLLLADSYNHKIKEINIKRRECHTVFPLPTKCPQSTDQNQNLTYAPEDYLNEPGGLCIHPTNNLVCIADTNNNAIKLLNMSTSTITKLKIKFPDRSPCDQSSVDGMPIMQKSLLTRGFTERNVTTVTIAPNGSVILNLQIYMPPGIGLTDGAPSAWQLQLDDMSQRMIAETSMHISLTALEPTPTLKLTVPSHWDNVTGTLHVEVILYFCESSGLCKMESLLFNIPFVCQINGEKTVNCMLQHSVCAS